MLLESCFPTTSLLAYLMEVTSFVVDSILEAHNPYTRKYATLTEAMLLGLDVGVLEMKLESPLLSLVILVGVTPISIFYPIPTLLKVLGLFKPSKFKSSFGLWPSFVLFGSVFL